MGLSNQYDSSGAGLYTDENGNALDSMLIVGESPWHFAKNEKLIRLRERGTKIHPLEVNAAAGLDWEVEKMSEREWLVAMGVDPKVAAAAVLDNKFITRRMDTGLKLGNVGRGYEVYPNAEAPEFLMNLVDSGELAVETAFSLYGGERVVWTFKLPQDIFIAGSKKEAVNLFLCLMNSHDRSQAITIFLTPVRVLCQNTLGWGLREAERIIRVRHTKNSSMKIDEARRALDISFKYAQELETIGAEMAETSFSDAEFESFLDSLLPVPEPVFNGSKQTNKPAITMAQAKRDTVTNIYTKHPTQKDITGTLWGAVQAVQFYADHVATAKYSPEARFRRAVVADNMGTKAFDKALALVS